MGHFNRDDRRGGFNKGFGGKSFGGPKRFDRRDGDRPKFKAVCSECGNDCELPFRPNGDRPVFCSNCFAKQNEGEDSRPTFDRPKRERSFMDEKPLFDAVCTKCGNPCQVPFRPVPGKSVFCENCFESEKSSKGSKESAEVMEQLKKLNSKLDALMNILTQGKTTEKVETKKESKKELDLDLPAPEAAKVKKEKNKAKTAAKKASAKKKK